MKPNERRVTFPVIGRKPTKIIGDFLEDLGLDVVRPSHTTDETIRTGSKYCANMVCIPLKVTLGNYIESLNRGANTLLAYDTKGFCRFRQYNKLHEFTLTGLGYDFEVVSLTPTNILSQLHRVSGRNRISILSTMLKYYKSLRATDLQSQQWSNTKSNIGIIGELYCCCDEKVNQGIEAKVRKFGGNPYNTVTTTDFIIDTIPLFNLFGIPAMFKRDEMKPYKEKAFEYMGKWRAGHAFQNLYNLLKLADMKVDGVVHVLPLACMPETTIEPYVNAICKDNNIPLLRIPLDENNAEANLETRIETFIELINWRKNGI